MTAWVSRLVPDTVRGFAVLAFVVTTVLLVLFGGTRFLPFAFLALVSFLVGCLLTGYLVYRRFMTWLGWTGADG